MAKDRGLDGSELLIYLNQQGLKYNPYAETFSNVINRLCLCGIIYNNKRRYLKEDIDLAIKKLHKKRPLTSHREQSRVVVNSKTSTTQF